MGSKMSKRNEIILVEDTKYTKLLVIWILDYDKSSIELYSLRNIP